MSSGFTVWLTGLPASGKRHVAACLVALLEARGLPVERIDSGKLRRTPLGARLGFSPAERDLNARRHALAARMLTRNGVVAVVSAVSPAAATRAAIRAELDGYVEVYVATPPDACAARDRSGNWARARAGTLADFTGVDAPYEAPTAPDVRVDISEISPEAAARTVLAALDAAGLAAPRGAPDEEDGPLLGAGLRVLGVEG